MCQAALGKGFFIASLPADYYIVDIMKGENKFPPRIVDFLASCLLGSRVPKCHPLLVLYGWPCKDIVIFSHSGGVYSRESAKRVQRL